jgi:hypothetical protein
MTAPFLLNPPATLTQISFPSHPSPSSYTKYIHFLFGLITTARRRKAVGKGGGGGKENEGNEIQM